MQQVYKTPIQIRFAHCDPAGIVFHPHFFTLLNGVLEDFFRDVVGIEFSEILSGEMGMPVAGVHADFVRPTRAGDRCEASLWIERLGTSSIRYAMTITCGGELRVQAVETQVCVKRSGKTMGAFPIPENIRAKLLPYVADADTKPLSLRA